MIASSCAAVVLTSAEATLHRAMRPPLAVARAPRDTLLRRHPRRSPFEVAEDVLDLRERGAQIVRDLLREDVRVGQARGVFERLVAYAAREISAHIREHLGPRVAQEVALRLVSYTNQMIGLVRCSKRPEEMRFKMAVAAMAGALGAVGEEKPPWIGVMLNPPLRSDPDPVWRLGAQLWELLGDTAAGIAELEIAVQLAPQWDRPRVEIAIVLLNLEDNAGALARLEADRRELVERRGTELAKRAAHLGQFMEKPWRVRHG